MNKETSDSATRDVVDIIKNLQAQVQQLELEREALIDACVMWRARYGKERAMANVFRRKLKYLETKEHHETPSAIRK